MKAVAVISMPTAYVKPKEVAEVLLTIRRGEEWQTQCRMSEEQALRLASECRKRGLTAEVSNG